MQTPKEMRIDEGAWECADSFVDRQINKSLLHVWPFRDSFPVDVRFLALDRSHNVPPHRPDHLEVVLFESGELAYEVEGNTCAVAKNDIIIVGNRSRHRCLPLCNAHAEARTIVLSFLPETVHSGSPIGDDIQYLMPFNLIGSTPHVIPGKVGLSREIFDLMERIHQKMPGECERSRLAIRTYLKMLLFTIVNYCSDTDEGRIAFRRKKEDSDRLEPIFEYLRQHYDERVHVNHAARICALSSSCFMNLFKETTGLSFIAYLNHYRVSKAQGLLASTSKPISAISMETGFCTQSYFGMVFRKVTGMTPLDYRVNAVHTAVNPPSTVKIPPMQ